jgi:hypothetical protein
VVCKGSVPASKQGCVCEQKCQPANAPNIALREIYKPSRHHRPSRQGPVALQTGAQTRVAAVQGRVLA